jgi:predicted DNA-binding protein (UPF0251 family)
MSRPKKERFVFRPPLYADFKPAGIQRHGSVPLSLELDEFEAIRLADYMGMEHSEAAEEMEISRSTFTRLVEKARSKIARFLVEGKHLQIGGGNIHFRGNLIRCHDCGHMFNIGFESDIDICPACGSGNLIDLAGGFGHGNCCRGHGRHGRR